MTGGAPDPSPRVTLGGDVAVNLESGTREVNDMRSVCEVVRASPPHGLSQSAVSAPPASFWRVVVWMAASVALTVTVASSALVSV
jgi:hypothetical protein